MRSGKRRKCSSRRGPGPAAKLRGFSLFGTVTRQESEFTETDNAGNSTTHVPEWIFSGGARYEHCGGWYGVLEGFYRGSSWVDPENTVKTPGFWTMDARVGWRRAFRWGRSDAELDVALAAKNLLDEEVFLEHRPGTIVPGPPREYFLTVGLGLQF